MKKLALTAALLSMSLSAFAMSDLSGTYNCQGYDTYAKTNFTTTMVFKSTGKDIYNISEVNTKNKNLSDKSVAIQTPHGLAVAYQYGSPMAINNNATFGVQIMKVSHGGKVISGPWVDYETMVPGKETCTRVASAANS